MSVPTHRVGHGQPWEELTDVGIRLWPDHEMPVVGHHRVVESAKGHAVVGFFQHTFERFLVAVLFEQRQSRYRTIQTTKTVPRPGLPIRPTGFV